MSAVFVFDIDGTLTPAGQGMTADMMAVMSGFMDGRKVYFVSRKPVGEIRKLVAKNILQSACGIFGCSGTEFWQKDRLVFSLHHEFEHDLLLLCQHFVDSSPFPHRHGNHIVENPCRLLVSVVGCQATPTERLRYLDWDKHLQEQTRLIDAINNSFPAYAASNEDECTIVITPKGWDKARVLGEVLNQEPGSSITFFGNRMSPGGDDYPLAHALRQHFMLHNPLPVKDYRDTIKCLNRIMICEQNSTAA